MNSRIWSDMPSNFSHCSRYSVTGKRPIPYTESAPFSLTFNERTPRAGFFKFSFSARKRSISAFISSSVGMVFNSLDTTWYAQISPDMSAINAIFFDFDGVLLDTEPVHWASWAEVLAPAGLTLTWEYYRDHCIGIDDRDMLRTMARQADPPHDWDSLWALYPAKKRLFQERMKAPEFEASLAGMLPALHRQFKLAVVSSSSCSEIE